MKLLILLTLFLSSCASYEQFKHLTEEYEIPKEIFKYDYNMTWQAVINVMNDYDLAVKNQESGILKTRWIDNTLALNFADSFGRNQAVKAAKYKIIINVIKGYAGNKEVSKVTIFKRQMVEKDFLQGWKVLPTDNIQEKAILYRISRVLNIEKKLKEIEEAVAKEQEANF